MSRIEREMMAEARQSRMEAERRQEAEQIGADIPTAPNGLVDDMQCPVSPEAIEHYLRELGGALAVAEYWERRFASVYGAP